MSNLAIKGHPTRGKEVIKILEMLGGKNIYNVSGSSKDYAYYVLEKGEIRTGIRIFKNEFYMFFTLEEFLEKYPYKVGDKVKNIYGAYGKVYMIKWIDNEIQYRLDFGHHTSGWYIVNELQPYKEQETMEETIKIDIPKGYEFAGVDDDSQQVVFEKISCQYPKTYEECCKHLMGKTNFQDFELVLTKLSTSTSYEHTISPAPPHIKLINDFYKLLICRDAYWKLAGDWKPDWCDENKLKYCIECSFGTIDKTRSIVNGCLLAFPTEEMRDTFYENFKEEIEKCKEIL